MHSVCSGLSPGPPAESKEQSDEAGPQAGSVQAVRTAPVLLASSLPSKCSACSSSM